MPFYILFTLGIILFIAAIYTIMEDHHYWRIVALKKKADAKHWQHMDLSAGVPLAKSRA